MLLIKLLSKLGEEQQRRGRATLKPHSLDEAEVREKREGIILIIDNDAHSS